jgi:hypothetical protein
MIILKGISLLKRYKNNLQYYTSLCYDIARHDDKDRNYAKQEENFNVSCLGFNWE